VSLVHNMQSQSPNMQGPSPHQPSTGPGVLAAAPSIPVQPPLNPIAPSPLPVPQYDCYPRPSEQLVNVTHTESYRPPCTPCFLAAQVRRVREPRHFRCPSVTRRLRRRPTLLPCINFVLFLVTRRCLLTPRVPRVSISPLPLIRSREFLMRLKSFIRG